MKDEYDRKRFFDMYETLDNKNKIKTQFRYGGVEVKPDNKILGPNQYSKVEIERLARQDQLSQQLRAREANKLKKIKPVQ
jgi:hypothetical protein